MNSRARRSALPLLAAAVLAALAGAPGAARASAPIGAPAAGGSANGSAWTQTYAEAILLLKLRLPCASVRTRAECKLSDAEKLIAQFDRRLAACKTHRGSTAGSEACVPDDLPDADPRSNLRDVRDGFPLLTARCAGGGTPVGGRFPAFRCRITVHDDANPDGPVVVSGKLLVTVTGKTTFSWQAI